jgi:hypothetical protein
MDQGDNDSIEKQQFLGSLAIVGFVAALAYILAKFGLPSLDWRPAASITFLHGAGIDLAPEPLEQQTYLTAVAAVLILPVVVSLSLRSRFAQARLRPEFGQAVEILLIAGVTLSWASSQDFIRQTLPLASDSGGTLVGFTALLVALWPARTAIARWTARRGPRNELMAFGLASAFTALLCAAGIYRNGDLTSTLPIISYHDQFTFTETYSVVGGLTPLVDFTPQYASVLPYLYAPFLMLKPMSIGMFTVVNTGAATLALLCGYGALRLLTGRPLRALFLYVPVVALASVPIPGAMDGGRVATVSTYFAVMPMRYAGPLVCLGLVALLAHRNGNRRLMIGVGIASGLTLINNFEFGLPTLCAVLVAAWISTYTARTGVRRTAQHLLPLAGGIVAALLLFVVLSVARTGQVPDPLAATYFSRQFAGAGFYMLPFGPVFAFPAIVFLTFAGAVLIGITPTLIGRRKANAHARVEAAVLTFTGIFGMGAFAYFVGRSHPSVLTAVFCAWGFALAALSHVALRWLSSTRGAGRVGSPLAILTIAMFVICGTAALGQSAYALEQVERIFTTSETARASAATPTKAIAIARDCISPETSSIIFLPYGLKIAQAANLQDHAPFNHPGSVKSAQQLAVLSNSIVRNHVRAFLSGPLAGELEATLRSRGFVRLAWFSNSLSASVFDTTEIVSVWGRPGDGAITCGLRGVPLASR